MVVLYSIKSNSNKMEKTKWMRKQKNTKNTIKSICYKKVPVSFLKDNIKSWFTTKKLLLCDLYKICSHENII